MRAANTEHALYSHKRTRSLIIAYKDSPAEQAEKFYLKSLDSDACVCDTSQAVSIDSHL
jgi:hypothetical protein